MGSTYMPKAPQTTETFPPSPLRPIRSWRDYAVAFVASVWDAQDRRHLHEDDWLRTIYLDTLGVKFTNFNLDDATKKRLVDSGREGARKYFAWLDSTGGPKKAWKEPLL